MQNITCICKFDYQLLHICKLEIFDVWLEISLDKLLLSRLKTGNASPVFYLSSCECKIAEFAKIQIYVFFKFAKSNLILGSSSFYSSVSLCNCIAQNNHDQQKAKNFYVNFDIYEFVFNFFLRLRVFTGESQSIGAKILNSRYTTSQKHDYTFLLHTYVLNEFLTADHLFATKYF